MYKFSWNPFILISHHLRHPFLAAYIYHCIQDSCLLGELLNNPQSTCLWGNKKLLSKDLTKWKTMYSKSKRLAEQRDIVVQIISVPNHRCSMQISRSNQRNCLLHSCRIGSYTGTSLKGAECPQLPLSANAGWGY